jgi:hypothetical protein
MKAGGGRGDVGVGLMSLNKMQPHLKIASTNNTACLFSSLILVTRSVQNKTCHTSDGSPRILTNMGNIAYRRETFYN